MPLDLKLAFTFLFTSLSLAVFHEFLSFGLVLTCRCFSFEPKVFTEGRSRWNEVKEFVWLVTDFLFFLVDRFSFFAYRLIAADIVDCLGSMQSFLVNVVNLVRWADSIEWLTVWLSPTDLAMAWITLSRQSLTSANPVDEKKAVFPRLLNLLFIEFLMKKPTSSVCFG